MDGIVVSGTFKAQAAEDIRAGERVSPVATGRAVVKHPQGLGVALVSAKGGYDLYVKYGAGPMDDEDTLPDIDAPAKRDEPVWYEVLALMLLGAFATLAGCGVFLAVTIGCFSFVKWVWRLAP